MISDMRVSWGTMKRAEHGSDAFTIAGSMTPQQLCRDLEKSSHIGALENK